MFCQTSFSDPSNLREVTVASLLPIQTNVYEHHLQQMARVPRLPEIDVVPYAEGRNLVVDGTHRTTLLHRAGRLATMAHVFDTDESVRYSHVNALQGRDTVDDVWQKYHDIWLPALRASGVEGWSSLAARP